MVWCVGILFLIKRELSLSQHSSALQITVKGKTNAELIMKALLTLHEQEIKKMMAH